MGVAAGVEEEAFTEGGAKELELLTDTLMESTRTLVITVVISIVGDVDTGFSVCEDWLSVGEVAGLLASDPADVDGYKLQTISIELKIEEVLDTDENKSKSN